MAASLANIRKNKAGILTLEGQLDRFVSITMTDGTEWRGILKGFDNNMNLVVADCDQMDRGNATRRIGATIIRGGAVSAVFSQDMKLLHSNPFQ